MAAALQILSSGARTVATAGPSSEGLLGQTAGEVAIMLIIDHTVSGGAISLTPKIQVMEPSNGTWVDYWVAAAAIVALTQSIYILTQRTDLLNGAAIFAAAGAIKEVISRPINGAEWRFFMAVGNANSQTYSVGGYRIYQA